VQTGRKGPLNRAGRASRLGRPAESIFGRPSARNTSPSLSEPAEKITQILALAQEEAEAYIAEARREAERIIAEARQEADAIRAQARP
jgi:cell division septum initiation protein DivIVA